MLLWVIHSGFLFCKEFITFFSIRSAICWYLLSQISHQWYFRTIRYNARWCSFTMAESFQGTFCPSLPWKPFPSTTHAQILWKVAFDRISKRSGNRRHRSNGLSPSVDFVQIRLDVPLFAYRSSWPVSPQDQNRVLSRSFQFHVWEPVDMLLRT